MSVRVLRCWLRMEESERLGLGERGAGWLLWAPFVGLALVVLASLDRSLFRFLVYEDSLLEWLQFVMFLAVMVLAGMIAWNLFRSGYRPAGMCYALLALVALFVAGEEIAWGVRLFEIAPPDSLAQINTQHTATIHNIHGFVDYFNLVMLVVGFYGSVVTWWLRARSARARGPLFDLFVPPLFLTTWFGVPFAYFLVLFAYKVAHKVVRLSALPQVTSTLVKSGEWSEFCLAFALTTWMALIWLGQRRDQVVTRLPQRSAEQVDIHG